MLSAPGYQLGSSLQTLSSERLIDDIELYNEVIVYKYVFLGIEKPIGFTHYIHHRNHM